jgi:hypothetical protein
MTKYTVRVNPTSGMVLERNINVTKHFTELNAALEECWGWHKSGPNGPIRSAELLRDGQVVDKFEEIERCAMEPLFSGNILCGCRTP